MKSYRAIKASTTKTSQKNYVLKSNNKKIP